MPTWFDHLEEHFSYKEFQFKKFYLLVNTSCPHFENINEGPAFRVFKMAFVYLSIVTAWFQKISIPPPHKGGYGGVKDPWNSRGYSVGKFDQYVLRFNTDSNTYQVGQNLFVSY